MLLLSYTWNYPIQDMAISKVPSLQNVGCGWTCIPILRLHLLIIIFPFVCASLMLIKIQQKVKVNQLMVPLLYGQASEIWRCRTMAAVSLVMIHTMIYWIRLHIY